MDKWVRNRATWTYKWADKKDKFLSRLGFLEKVLKNQDRSYEHQIVHRNNTVLEFAEKTLFFK